MFGTSGRSAWVARHAAGCIHSVDEGAAAAVESQGGSWVPMHGKTTNVMHSTLLLRAYHAQTHMQNHKEPAGSSASFKVLE